MTPDLLDELLDRSAPATRTIDSPDLRAMIGDAAREVRPPRRRRVGIAAGALAVLLVGGAGVATATDLVPWDERAQDPYALLSFQLPSGVTCEQRIIELAADPAAARWLREFSSERDLVAMADVEGYLARMDTWEQPQYSDRDDRLWQGINGAVWELVLAQAHEAGFPNGALAGSSSQTYCVDGAGQIVYPNGDLYAPGAGS
ncbi:hypothetical protein [Microbacterium sp. NPDC058389]|uniref:hypothetical protein n=1 Tax=Microbacterium sp. NPDC058389 TaxID=3346475 RepID=UPI00364C3D45